LVAETYAKAYWAGESFLLKKETVPEDKLVHLALLNFPKPNPMGEGRLDARICVT